MNYYKFSYLLFLTILTACIAVEDTVVPAPTFQQYSAAPIYFKSVVVEDPISRTSSKNIETKLKNGFSSYSRARFQSSTSHPNDLIISPVQLEVSKGYLQVGGNHDLFSAWKSYDQYILSSNIKISLSCESSRQILVETVTVTKTTKVPASYSPYERDIHLLGVLEEYILNIDEALVSAVNKNLSNC